MEQIRLKLPGTEDFLTQEAYRKLCANLQFCGQDIRVIAFCGCGEQVGKTMVSLHVAKSLSELGKNVLFLDGDMRKSVMAGGFTNIRNAAGLSEVLTVSMGVEECVRTTQYPNLRLMFAGKAPMNPVELLSGAHFQTLIREVRKTYDYIIVDTPSLDMVIDAAVVAANCDGAVLVVNSGVTRCRQAQEAVEQLRRSGTKILGVVRNHNGRRKKRRK